MFNVFTSRFQKLKQCTNVTSTIARLQNWGMEGGGGAYSMGGGGAKEISADRSGAYSKGALIRGFTVLQLGL